MTLVCGILYAQLMYSHRFRWEYINHIKCELEMQPILLSNPTVWAQRTSQVEHETVQ